MGVEVSRVPIEAKPLVGAMHHGAGMLSTAMAGWFTDSEPEGRPNQRLTKKD